MPVHDWARVDAGLFHHFRQGWACRLCDAFNGGCLPADYFALLERPIKAPSPDFLTLELSSEMGAYARKANRITVRHRHGDVVAVVEIVSPGNKASRAELRTFVEKSVEYLCQGVHLLVVDLFPPGKRDPQGIHKVIWDEIEEKDLEAPPDRPLTLAAYSAGPEKVANVEFVGVGDALPDMPLFLKPESGIPVPLEATYRATWDVFPGALKGLLEGPPKE
jgi:hypothetical protein